MRADQLYQDIINARTFSEIQAAIDDAEPVNCDAEPVNFMQNLYEKMRK